MPKAARTYMLHFSLAMALYALTVIGVIWLVQQSAPAWWHTLLALMPTVPLVLALVALLRFLNRMDELQQRIQLNAIAFAAGATGLASFAYGFLESVGWPHLSPIWILPLMSVLWGLALAVLNWRYR